MKLLFKLKLDLFERQLLVMSDNSNKFKGKCSPKFTIDVCVHIARFLLRLISYDVMNSV